MILVLTLVILLLGGIAGSFAVAYGKISLGNPSIESSLTRLVLSLPFTPKTPKYLLEAAALAHKKVTQHALEISIAADAGGLSQYLGVTGLDGLIKGSVDYTDPKNPRLTLNATLTKDLNFDIRKNGKFIYFKINKLPLTLLMPILGLTETSSLEQALDKWVVYDSSTLDTQASKLLESENQQNSSYTNKFITDTVDKFLDKELLKEIKVESVTEEGTQTYELSLSPSGETLDYLADKMRDQKSKTSTYYQAVKPSDYIKDLKINLWLDKQSYLVRKLSVVFRLYTPVSAPGQTPALTNLPFFPFAKQEIPVSLVLKLSDFGQSFKVETPTEALTPEEYLKIILDKSDPNSRPK